MEKQPFDKEQLDQIAGLFDGNSKPIEDEPFFEFSAEKRKMYSDAHKAKEAAKSPEQKEAERFGPEHAQLRKSGRAIRDLALKSQDTLSPEQKLQVNQQIQEINEQLKGRQPEGMMLQLPFPEIIKELGE